MGRITTSRSPADHFLAPAPDAPISAVISPGRASPVTPRKRRTVSFVSECTISYVIPSKARVAGVKGSDEAAVWLSSRLAGRA